MRNTITGALALLVALALVGCGSDDPAAPEPAPPAPSRSGLVYTVAGTGVAGLGGENTDPLQSDLYLVQDVTIGPDGLLYVVDWNNHRIRVIENGQIRTIIGTGLLGDADEGPALQVGLNHPTNVSFGPDGNLYMAAWHNSKIMKYDMATGFLSIYCAWAGARGWFGDGGPAYDAIINLPSSTAWGPDGNLYISDQGNFCIRMIDFDTEIISTPIAQGHQAGFCGDGGPAVDACLNQPFGQSATPAARISFDSQGNLYLCDTRNLRVRKVDTNGIITTIAGNGLFGYSGDGGDATAATLKFPADVAIDPLTGNCYIADKDNHVIRMVDGNGIITTVAGTGVAGFTEDGAKALEAQFFEPYGICFDSAGNLYIADTKNHRVRVLYR